MAIDLVYMLKLVQDIAIDGFEKKFSICLNQY